MLILFPVMTQETALKILQTGANVFLTGEPGAGKTYVINEYISWLEAAKLSVAVTASTGIAATHIGGLTIHSWSGVGTKDTLTKYDLDQIISNERVTKRIKKAHVLVIDEISMLDGKLLDMVEVICRTVRQKGDPFGGLQVVCVGDFFQLPPISRSGDVTRYAFESKAWEKLKPLVCYLSEQHRQEDELLLSLLGSIRSGDVEEEHYTLLREQTDIAYEDVEPTKLYTHNADVDSVNAARLKELSGSVRSFSLSGKGNKTLQESLVRNCLSPATLFLKEEAMVMCTKNNFEAGYVNGTLGRVVGFDSYEGHPIIETADKRRITVEPTTWEMSHEGKVMASIEQIPLRLAWAITVHKSQGMSLDAVEVDLSKSFVYGQGYVALSRVRSLAGLKVNGINANALMVDPKIIEQDKRFYAESESAEEFVNVTDEEELKQMQVAFVTAGGGRIPNNKDVKEAKEKVSVASVARINTNVETANLLKEKGKIEAVAKVRGYTYGTIVSHIENLVESGDLKLEDIHNIAEREYGWISIPGDLKEALRKNGVEKLKPLHEATKEQYDYNTIRIARCLYKLLEKES